MTSRTGVSHLETPRTVITLGPGGFCRGSVGWPISRVWRKNGNRRAIRPVIRHMVVHGQHDGIPELASPRTSARGPGIALRRRECFRRVIIGSAIFAISYAETLVLDKAPRISHLCRDDRAGG